MHYNHRNTFLKDGNTIFTIYAVSSNKNNNKIVYLIAYATFFYNMSTFQEALF